MGGCPMVEDTQEHRELFGEDGTNVEYFRSNEELVEKARLLDPGPRPTRSSSEERHEAHHKRQPHLQGSAAANA